MKNRMRIRCPSVPTLRVAETEAFEKDVLRRASLKPYSDFDR